MLTKVVNAKYVKEYMIEFTFNDGLTGVVDLKESFRGPVFQPLKDIKNFRKFQLNRWTIEWECGADLAPEYLYDLALKQNQELQKA